MCTIIFQKKQIIKLSVLVILTLTGCATNDTSLHDSSALASINKQSSVPRNNPIKVLSIVDGEANSLGAVSGEMQGAANSQAKAITKAVNVSKASISCKQATFRIASAAKAKSGKLKGAELRSAIMEATANAANKFGIDVGCVTPVNVAGAASRLTGMYPASGPTMGLAKAGGLAGAAGAAGSPAGGFSIGGFFRGVRSFFSPHNRVFKVYGGSTNASPAFSGGAFANLMKPISNIDETPEDLGNFIYVLFNKRIAEDGLTMNDYRRKCLIVLEKVNSYLPESQDSNGNKPPINGLLVPALATNESGAVPLKSYDFILARSIISKINKDASHLKSFESLNNEGPYLVMSGSPLKDIDKWGNISVIDFSSMHHTGVEQPLDDFLKRFENENLGTSPLTVLEKSTIFGMSFVVSSLGFPMDKASGLF